MLRKREPKSERRGSYSSVSACFGGTMRRVVSATISAISIIACANQVNVLDPNDAGADASTQQEGSADVAAESNDSGDDGGVAFCAVKGGACGTYDECCGGMCVDGYCWEPPTKCSVTGGSCTGDGDCCSHKCSNGTCVAGCKEGGHACNGQGLQSDCCNMLGCGIDGCVPYPGPPEGACKHVGTTCGSDFDCCDGHCVTQKCALITCPPLGSACSKWTDCCSGACSNGACVDHPPCKFAGSCSGARDCCTNQCVMGSCTTPEVILNCPHLVWGGKFVAKCFNCMSDNCCTEKSSASITWQICFNNCMADTSNYPNGTFDAYHACAAKCGAASIALTNCMDDHCQPECPK